MTLSRIDVAAERHGDACLHAPAVERVDDSNVVAVGRTLAAVGIRIREAAPGVVPGSGNREDIRRKRPGLGRAEIEPGERIVVLDPPE